MPQKGSGFLEFVGGGGNDDDEIMTPNNRYLASLPQLLHLRLNNLMNDFKAIAKNILITLFK